MNTKIDSIVKVIAISNDSIFLFGLKELLKKPTTSIELIEIAYDAATGYELTKSLEPSVVLMDLSLRTSAMSSVQAISRISTAVPETKIIVLTADETIDSIMGALRAGANGYLLKSITIQELKDAIFTVTQNGSVMSPPVTKKVLQVMSHPVSKYFTTTVREIQILELMVGGATNKSIAKTLSLSVRTIEAHTAKIFQKLGVSSRTEAVVQALRIGIIESPPALPA